jgi:signal transduction histidine kinase
MNGVRVQLNLLVAATTSLVLLAFLAPIGLLLRGSAEQRAVAAASTQAQSAAALVALGQTPHLTNGPSESQLTVFYADGRRAGAPAGLSPSVELARRGQAFTARTDGGIEVLVPVQGLDAGTAVVRAFAPDELLHEGVLRDWGALAGLGVVLFALSLLFADRMGRRLVRSVTALAATADRLAAGDLDARVVPSDTPELRRVGLELNRLAARIQQLLQAERQEVADLAHRLRTPITALRLDVDSVHDANDQARLSTDVDALVRGVDEVIRTARRPMREGAHARADLVAVARNRTAFWSALAEDSGRSLALDLPTAPIPVRVPPQDLAAALDALLENVFSHTADGTPLRVQVTPTADGGVVTVEDAGHGFGATTPPATDGSTGLGLDIARRTAQAAGGSMRQGTGPLGGALVELTFPAA